MKRKKRVNFIDTVFPQIRPEGIIFLQGLQLRVLLEGVDYSKKLPFLEIKARLNII